MGRPLSRIRTRLLVVNVAVILVGFAALALVIGGQIEEAARADYEKRLENEIQLIALSIGQVYTTDNASRVEDLIIYYEDQIGGDLRLLDFFSDRPGSDNGWVVPFALPDFNMDTLFFEGVPWPLDRRDRFLPMERIEATFAAMPEIELALQGDVGVVQRQDESGKPRLFTAAPVTRDRQPTLVQLSVPTANLEALIWERWAALLGVMVLTATLSLLAALLVARSIIKPLTLLRDSALKVADGALDHRVEYTRPDEIGDVARAFNLMVDHVGDMLEAQRAFASNTSHELRTPLTSVRLRTEALRVDSTLDEAERARYIAEIDDEMGRLAVLIDDLTLLSRVDAGRLALGDETISLTRFLRSLATSMQPAAQARCIALTLDLPDALLTVRGSLNHLTMVFRNLLENALKYTPEGGSVRLRLAQRDADWVDASIEDDGIGIEPERLPRLFERFYRADESHNRDVPGSGLGLAIVQGIVSAYGGTVTVFSAGPGQGTTATVIWPAAPLEGEDLTLD